MPISHRWHFSRRNSFHAFRGSSTIQKGIYQTGKQRAMTLAAWNWYLKKHIPGFVASLELWKHSLKALCKFLLFLEWCLAGLWVLLRPTWLNKRAPKALLGQTTVLITLIVLLRLIITTIMSQLGAERADSRHLVQQWGINWACAKSMTLSQPS